MTEQYEAVFVDMVRKSWKVHSEIDQVTRVDDVLLGAVVTACVRLGKSLIDLNSDGSSHFVRFEDLQSRERLTFRLTHMTPDVPSARTLGQLANVVIGLGKPVTDLGRLWGSLKAEMKSAFLTADEPGVITLDADLTAGYVYAQVPLIWRLDDYLKGSLWKPDYETIASHVYCCEVSLGKYLDGRLRLA
jgi:hypothetical protein